MKACWATKRAPTGKSFAILWASDFRTHLTEKRWTAYCARLKAAEARWSASPARPALQIGGNDITDRHFSDSTRRPCAPPWTGGAAWRLQSLHFTGQEQPALGGLPHGFFDEIALAADWYTGDSVFEAPGEHKLTDLEWCEAELATDSQWRCHRPRPHRNAQGSDRENPALLRRHAAGRIRPHFSLERLGQGRAAAGPFHPAAGCLRYRSA